MKKLGRLIWLFLLLLFFVGAIFYIQDKRLPVPKTNEMKWGITFSQKMSQSLGLNWQDNYLAILNDLQPDGIRLVAYWDLVQPRPETYDFTDLDWQIEQAQKNHIPITIAIGQKAPRWPECHYPTWVNKDNQAEKQEALLRYLQVVIEHYRNTPGLQYWQIENEPFVKLVMIQCPQTSYKFVAQEVVLAKKLDPTHPILMTDSGQTGSWYKAAKLADVFGVSYYRKVYSPLIGTYSYPYIAGRIGLSRFLSHKPKLPLIVSELQAEPWGNGQIWNLSAEDQKQIYTPDDFRQTIQAAQATRLSTYYLWGAEWWYSMKLKNEPVYWQMVKDYIDSSRGTQTFPTGFLWGAATASHQVEGNTINDWTDWEKDHALFLAKEAESNYAKAIPNWSTVATQATNPQNYISGQAADSYNRYDQDDTLAQSLGLNAQRISLEWSRIEPQRGQFDSAAVAHYQAVIDDMRSKGQEPFVTLWHYTLPIWFAQKGGWTAPDAAQDFADYAKKATSEIHGVRYWITENEPLIYAQDAYVLGNRPPGKKSIFDYMRVLHHLRDGHKLAYAAIKGNNPAAQVGIAADVYSFNASFSRPWSLVLRPLADWWRNKYFLNHINSTQDFIGVNYYQHIRLDGKANNAHYSDLGWELNTQGIYSLLMELKQYNKPIYITENGIADATDSQRSDYMRGILTSVHKAIQDGADIRGYFYWSLIDNFEWEKGFWPRFGLINVDYDTQTRTIRDSAYDYAEIIHNNAIFMK